MQPHSLIMGKTRSFDKRIFSRLGRPAISFAIAALLSLSGYHGSAFAQNLDGYASETPSKPRLSSPFTRGLQGLLGFNRMAAWIGSRKVEDKIREKVDGHIDVDIEPYSASDLAEGKARQLTVKGEDLVYDDAFYVSHFYLQTDDRTPIWVNPENGKLRSPVEADVTIHLQDDDVNRSFQTQHMRELLNDVHFSLFSGEQRLRLIKPQVDFIPNRLRFSTQLASKAPDAGKPIPIKLETGLEPQGDRSLIRFKDLTIAPIPGISNMDMVEAVVEEALQYVLKPSRLMPIDHGNMEIKSVQLSEGNLVVKGRVRLLPHS